MTGLTMSESSHQGPAIAFKHQPLEQQGIDGDKVLNIHIVDSSQVDTLSLVAFVCYCFNHYTYIYTQNILLLVRWI